MTTLSGLLRLREFISVAFHQTWDLAVDARLIFPVGLCGGVQTAPPKTSSCPAQS